MAPDEIRVRLPDPNILEALARLPGVSFQRENATGEGEFISIRGLDAAFVTTTFDGVRTGTADEFRRTALDITTGDNISLVRVLKSPLAEHASEGVMGAKSEPASGFASRLPTLREQAFVRMELQDMLK